MGVMQTDEIWSEVAKSSQAEFGYFLTVLVLMQKTVKVTKMTDILDRKVDC